MDTDTLITVAFVAVIIAFQLFGSVAGRLLKKGQTAPDKPAKAEGLLKTLTSRVNREIQLAMEQAAASRATTTPATAPKQSDRPPGGDERTLRVASTEGWSDAERADRFRPKKPDMTAAADSTPEETALIEDIRQELLEAAAVKEFGARPATVEDSHASAGSEPGAEYEGAELRRAVIWSEILAPPVALRE